MAFRRKMNKRRSRRLFKRASGHHKRNRRTGVRRGGYRI